MTWRFSSLCGVMLLFASSEAIAQSRPAQCLLEVKGVHYLGGPCVFTSLDRLGSFRITDVQGLNLIAQINASKKDEGKAVWNGPLGGTGPGKVLGDAYRSGGCWTLNDLDGNDKRFAYLRVGIERKDLPRTIAQDATAIDYCVLRITGRYVRRDRISARPGLCQCPDYDQGQQRRSCHLLPRV